MQPSDSVQNGETKVPDQPAADASAAADSASRETVVDVEDRRASPRRKKLMRVLVRNDAAALEPFTGWILDRSMGGMCLVLDHEIEAGTILAVSRVPQTVASRWVEMRVQNVREQDSTWEIGCEYLRVPSWEVMLQFE